MTEFERARERERERARKTRIEIRAERLFFRKTRVRNSEKYKEW